MANQSNTNITPAYPEAPVFDSQMTITLYSVLLVWSLLGNVLVIAVVLGNRNLRTNFNYLIVNMALSDLFIPLVTLPFRIVEEANGPQWLVDGPLGQVLCKLCYFLTDITPVVSILSLVIITVNRFVSIAHPMKCRLLRGKITWILIAFTWITSMALFSPYFYTFRLVQDIKGVTLCIGDWALAFDSSTARNIFITIVTMVAFLIPLTTIIVLYAIMLYQLRKQSKKVVHMLNNRQILIRQRRDKHILYICIAIIVSFVCLVGPFFCFMFVMNFIWRWDFTGRLEEVQKVLFAVQYLTYLSSAINPCIYFTFMREYRNGLKRLLVCSKRKSTSFLSRGRASTKLSIFKEYFPLSIIKNEKGES